MNDNKFMSLHASLCLQKIVMTLLEPSFLTAGHKTFVLKPQRDIGTCFDNERSKVKSIAQNQPRRTVGIKRQINS